MKIRISFSDEEREDGRYTESSGIQYCLCAATRIFMFIQSVALHYINKIACYITLYSKRRLLQNESAHKRTKLLSLQIQKLNLKAYGQ